MRHLCLAFFSMIFILPFSYSGITEECSISEVDATPQPCDESGFFTVLINFEYANGGEQGFRIQGNGNNYGNFEYADLPVTVGPLEGDGTTIYEFVVTDNQFGDCSNWTAIDPVDCGGGGNECHIYDLIVDDHPCEEGMFYVHMDFEYQNVSEGFRLRVNEDVYGDFSYNDLPLQNVGPFTGDGSTVYLFEVFDLHYDACGDVAELGPIDCGGTGDCWISELSVVETECEDGTFFVWIDFDYQNVSGDGFKLFINEDLFGTFGYEELPVQAGALPGDGTTSHHFLVRDIVFEGCASDASIDPVNCNGGGGECSIGELDITVLPCNDEGFFNVLLDFEYENVGEMGFHVQGNGTHYGDYYYEDLPVEIGPLEGDGVTVYEFLVKDNQVEGCMEDDFIDPVYCGDAPRFDNLSLDVATCASGEFYLAMDFDPVNMSTDTFSFYVNGKIYGKYLFESLPMTVGPWPADGATNYDFMVRESGLERYGDWEKLWSFTCETLRIKENSEIKPTIMPNPTKGDVMIDIGTDMKAYVNIYDLTGKSIIERNFTGKTELDIGGNPHGLYIVRIAVGKQIFLKKLIFR